MNITLCYGSKTNIVFRAEIKTKAVTGATVIVTGALHADIATGDWNLQDWKMTDHQKTGRGVEFAGLENDWPENDGVEQEQMYILHTTKNFNVYDM